MSSSGTTEARHESIARESSILGSTHYRRCMRAFMSGDRTRGDPARQFSSIAALLVCLISLGCQCEPPTDAELLARFRANAQDMEQIIDFLRTDKAVWGIEVHGSARADRFVGEAGPTSPASVGVTDQRLEQYTTRLRKLGVARVQVLALPGSRLSDDTTVRFAVAECWYLRRKWAKGYQYNVGPRRPSPFELETDDTDRLRAGRKGKGLLLCFRPIDEHWSITYVRDF